VCTNSPQCYIMTVQGQLVRRFASGKKEGSGGDFNCATVSPQGELHAILCLSRFFFVWTIVVSSDVFSPVAGFLVSLPHW